jgi:hypothetical protein
MAEWTTKWLSCTGSWACGVGRLDRGRVGSIGAQLGSRAWGWFERTVTKHYPCTIPCALWLHHNISINTQVHFSLEQECRYPIPLEYILENLVTITCFCWSLLEVIPLNPKLRGYNLGVALNSFKSHCKSFPSFGSSKGTWSCRPLSLISLGQSLPW